MTTEKWMNEVQSMLDKEQVRDCIGRLARGEDRRDEAIIQGCFWPDAKTDFGIFAGQFRDYLNWVVPGSPAVLLTQHKLGQSLIQVRDNDAAAETLVTAYHRVNMGTQESDLVIGGRYLDRLQRRAGEWRILQRTMLYDWVQDWGTSADWSHGLMGEPFSAEHFVGATAEDYSVGFFNDFLRGA